MFKSSFKHDFRAFLAINFSAFFMLAVLLLMLSLVSVVVYLGASHLWERDIHFVQFAPASEQENRFVVLSSHLPKDLTNQSLLTLSYPDPKRAAFDQLTVKSSNIVSVTKPSNVASWHLHSGRVKFGVAGELLENGGIAQNITLAQAIEKVAQAQSRISTELNVQLLQLHKAIAQLERDGVVVSAPKYQGYYQTLTRVQAELVHLRADVARFELEVSDASGVIETINLKDLVRFSYVNQLNLLDKCAVVVRKFFQLLTSTSSTNLQSGGFFPAMFGTVTMVLLMTLFVTPLGVLVAVYLHEYAPRGVFTSLIRISVNNLAGVPSIVYGVFGLGFFVYGLGGHIDQLLFAQTLPSPTFGAPGLLWASLTMAMLTLPVVIVATEEGLKRVPKNLMVGSYALGATKLETVWRIALPLASPGILTGIIMAIARGAGEVAPLLLVGAVKFAPLLPVDGTYPYVHLERQFMHLGTFIFHGTFNSLDPEYGASMIFVSCMLLLIIVLCLNFIAISVRNKLRARYTTMVSE